MEKENKNGNDKPFSLLHSVAMGGIIGSNGYTFQDRYIVCHIPKWLSDPQFLHLMNEGTGDVDIVYTDGTQYYYDHIQIKDHKVTPGEFAEVIKGFTKIDLDTGKSYRSFVLASPALSQQINSLADALDRYRNAEKLYAPEDKETILKTTFEALNKKIEDAGLIDHANFIINKLGFDTGRFDFSNNDTCKQMFTASLVDHPEYSKYFSNVVKPVYSKLIEEVIASKGKVLANQQIHELIKGVLSTAKISSEGTVLHIHNWTQEMFDPAPAIELDWSSYFDRSTRSVPEADIWNDKLIPQLYKTRQEIAKTTINRHIIFRGKCTLSTGLALGMSFPEIGNWSFELLQYPQTWRSDAQKIAGYVINYEEVDPILHELNTDSKEIAVIFNITGQALEEVVSYFKNNNIPISKLILIQPSLTPGVLSIPNDREAVSLASASKDIIKAMTTKYNAHKTHLFYFGPLGLSIFLGQRLTSVGYIQLYEFQDPGYKPSCLIKT
ncbi:dsDNA nuclease domain-containing protein [Parafilimonas terrae]|uniref:Uncharacterized protein n=1 Tax=Parafilimonas terrae TaxID=1465490 RepID=A0A1I5TBI9_9BACT|nr:dsDNA nuclease domain-containing protein [Parafilimonas terrae]SFP80413.1 hypothetical protein SAMN05444277_10235 [Parafilimonas terrae]